MESTHAYIERKRSSEPFFDFSRTGGITSVDPKQFRHYGPMAQDFFAAFGNDGMGTIGTPTTINSGDMVGVLMIGVQTLEKRTVELRQENNLLKETVETFKAENADLKARLERLERAIGSYALATNTE